MGLVSSTVPFRHPSESDLADSRHAADEISIAEEREAAITGGGGGRDGTHFFGEEGEKVAAARSCASWRMLTISPATSSKFSAKWLNRICSAPTPSADDDRDRR